MNQDRKIAVRLAVASKSLEKAIEALKNLPCTDEIILTLNTINNQIHKREEFQENPFGNNSVDYVYALSR